MTPSTNRPHVTLSYAQSLDGSIAARRGQPLRLSGDASMRMTHQLRAEHDAILVGIGTVSADNPALTVRHVDGPNPQPVILDSQLRCPRHAKLLQRSVWIATTDAASAECERELAAYGAIVKRLPQDAHGQVNLEAFLAWLHEQGVRSLMIEGGAKIIASFLAAQLVDRAVITVAPLFVGGLNVVEAAQRLPRLMDVQVRQLEQDVIIEGRVVYAEGEPSG